MWAPRGQARAAYWSPNTHFADRRAPQATQASPERVFYPMQQQQQGRGMVGGPQQQQGRGMVGGPRGSPLRQALPFSPQLIPVQRGGCVYFVSKNELEMEEQAQTMPVLSAPAITVSPRTRTLRTMFLPEDWRAYFASQTQIRLSSLPPDDPVLKEVPPQFHSVLPLDETRVHASGHFGYPSFMYKVTSADSGLVHALRRIDNVRVSPDIVKMVMMKWATVGETASIVSFQEAFVARGALFLVHDFVPGAKTMAQVFLKGGHSLPEDTLWEFAGVFASAPFNLYAAMILDAIRVVHENGLAVRCIDVHHVLVTSPNRIRVGSVGVMDIVDHSSTKPIAEHQMLDFVRTARLLLAIGCGSESALKNIPLALENFGRRYSHRLKQFVLMLSSDQARLDNAQAFLGATSMAMASKALSHADGVERLLAQEAENGRLLRLLLKMNLILDRPEDKRSQESGNQYLLRLFKHYVFHQIGESGEPILDYAHMTESLNKLDIGSLEKILLMSSDSRNILFATFADVLDASEKAYEELLDRKRSAKGKQRASRASRHSKRPCRAPALTFAAAGGSTVPVLSPPPIGGPTSRALTPPASLQPATSMPAEPPREQSRTPPVGMMGALNVSAPEFKPAFLKK